MVWVDDFLGDSLGPECQGDELWEVVDKEGGGEVLIPELLQRWEESEEYDWSGPVYEIGGRCRGWAREEEELAEGFGDLQLLPCEEGSGAGRGEQRSWKKCRRGKGGARRPSGPGGGWGTSGGKGGKQKVEKDVVKQNRERKAIDPDEVQNWEED
jgi:hypothetical protein